MGKNEILWQSLPAPDWIRGYPCGNGRVGFMLWGLPGQEVLSLNHEALFRRAIRKEIKLAPFMDTIRQLVLDRRCKEAEKIIQEATKELSPDCNPFQCFCDLKFSFPAKAEDYNRSLSMREGITRVQSAAYRMEAFTDLASGTNVAKLCFDAPTTVVLQYDREEDPDCKTCISTQSHIYKFYGRFVENVEFCADTVVLTDGVVQYGGTVTVTDCTWLETRTALAILPEPLLISETTYEERKRAHTTAFAEAYDRFSLDLGAEEQNSEEIWNLAAGGEHFDLALCEYYVNLAKYVYISAGGGKLPMNLQGLWCGTIDPMWSCSYTTDINVQMAYMPSNAMGFGEYQMALFDWIDSHTDVMEKQCEDIFGVPNGAYIPQYTDMDMVPTCWRDYGPFQVLWSGGAAWLSRHYYEYWKYTDDNEFMLRRGLPFMKRCAAFYEGFLTRTPEGKLRICPSCNPENWTDTWDQLMDSATMDLSIIHDLMQNLLDVCSVLKLEEPKADLWRSIDEDLVDYPMYKDGRIAEYWTPAPVVDESHRHLSHLYGLHPARLFGDDPHLLTAARKAQEKRLEMGYSNTSSWAISWHACIAARYGDGERAQRYINNFFEGMVMENYLPSHNDWREGTQYCHGQRVFQIDAIFGISAAIAEMLIDSRNQGTVLLPCLPKDIQKNGSVKGLRGYHGVTYDIKWKDGAVTALTIHTKKDMKLYLSCGIAGVPSTVYTLKKGINQIL